jgi:hypothetical protein
MSTAECLPIWMRILDRMMRVLPVDSEGLIEITVLRERIADALAGDLGSIEDIEDRLRGLAMRHLSVLAEATDEAMGELFALVDPIAYDLQRATAAGTLNESDRASARGFVAMLESCAVRPAT